MTRFFEINKLLVDLKEFQISNISFNLEKGEYLCVIGPTGAGKTIILESIIGFHKIDSGKIFLNGEDITFLPPEKRKIGIIYQDYSLFPHFSVKKNIEYGLSGKSGRSMDELINVLNISHLLQRFPETLSGGEQQRVALARALIAEPSLLLMDEPFSALDNQAKLKTRRLIRDIVRKFKVTVIHITHDFDDIFALADKVAVIKDGELLQFGSLDSIMFQPANEFVAEFTDTNILEGVVLSSDDNLSVVQVGEMQLLSIDKFKKGALVKLAIRPENIILFENMPENLSARNIISAEYEDCIISSNVCHVVLKAGTQRLKAVLTVPSFKEFNFQKGDKVKAVIKATNVRII